MTQRDPVSHRVPTVSRTPRDPVSLPLEGDTRGTRSEHPAGVSPDRTALELARLRAKHRRFAQVTNRLITEMHAEIRRLRALSKEES